MPSDARQTVLPEWHNPNLKADRLRAFPYLKSTKILDDAPGTKTHLVHEGETIDVEDKTGETFCGRWKCNCTTIDSELEVLNVTRNMCKLCLHRLEQHEVETLAAMASVASQHEITADDILNQ